MKLEFPDMIGLANLVLFLNLGFSEMITIKLLFLVKRDFYWSRTLK